MLGRLVRATSKFPMVSDAQWVCEWCSQSKPISNFASIFRWFLPRYCRVTGEAAGWPHPSCKFRARLAERIAYRVAKQARTDTMSELHGKHLGELRGHELARPANSPEMMMRKDLD